MGNITDDRLMGLDLINQNRVIKRDRDKILVKVTKPGLGYRKVMLQGNYLSRATGKKDLVRNAAHGL